MTVLWTCARWGSLPGQQTLAGWPLALLPLLKAPVIPCSHKAQPPLLLRRLEWPPVLVPTTLTHGKGHSGAAEPPLRLRAPGRARTHCSPGPSRPSLAVTRITITWLLSLITFCTKLPLPKQPALALLTSQSFRNRPADEQCFQGLGASLSLEHWLFTVEFIAFWLQTAAEALDTTFLMLGKHLCLT